MQWKLAASDASSFVMPLPFEIVANLPQPLHLPLPVEAGEAGLAGEELLHGGLLEVALLGDEPIQPAQQRIHIAQRRRDGALFGLGWNGNSYASRSAEVMCSIVVPSACQISLTRGLSMCSGKLDTSLISRASSEADRVPLTSGLRQRARLEHAEPRQVDRRSASTTSPVLDRRSCNVARSTLAVVEACRP